MKHVVTTLPISPRTNPSVGFFALPVLTDLLSGICGQESVIPVNIFGSKADAKEARGEYLKGLHYLKVDLSNVWIDELELSSQMVQSWLLQGLSQGWLSYGDQFLWICPCGKTEVMDEAESLSIQDFHATTYNLVSGQILCRLCQQPAVRTNECRLLLAFPHWRPDVVMEPGYCRKELSELLGKFGGRKIPLNRRRDTGFTLVFDGESLNLDPDLAWMLYPTALYQSRSLQIETVLVGHKTLKHVAYCLLTTVLAGCPLPKLVISVPYVTVGESLTLKDLLGHSPRTIRTLLGFAFGCKRKALSIPKDRLYWIEHSIEVQPPEQLLCEDEPWQLLQSLWREFSQERMIKLLSKLRSHKRQVLDLQEQLVLRNVLKP